MNQEANMMNKIEWLATFCVVATAVALLGAANEAEAVTCNVVELTPCLPAFTSSNPPSIQCCTKLKEQTPCLCQYMKDPKLGKYIKSPEAKKVESICKVTVQC